MLDSKEFIHSFVDSMLLVLTKAQSTILSLIGQLIKKGSWHLISPLMVSI